LDVFGTGTVIEKVNSRYRYPGERRMKDLNFFLTWMFFGTGTVIEKMNLEYWYPGEKR